VVKSRQTFTVITQQHVTRTTNKLPEVLAQGLLYCHVTIKNIKIAGFPRVLYYYENLFS